MRYAVYFLIFMVLSGAGFYIGSQSHIPGQGLFFAEVEDRGPANSANEVQNLLNKSILVEDRGGLFSLTLTDSENTFCEALINLGAKNYELFLIEQNSATSGERAYIKVSGDCVGEKDFVVFDKTFCDRDIKQLILGFETEKGRRFDFVDFSDYFPTKMAVVSLHALQSGARETAGPSFEETALDKFAISCNAD